MPGGYSKYLSTLQIICTVIDKHQLSSKSALITLIQSALDEKKPDNSRNIVSFLLRTKLLQEESGRYIIGRWTRRWLETGDPGIVIALIHGQVQFVGEMLAELRRTPRSTAELLSIASKYKLEWGTDKQISNRRGWLQSAEFIEINDKKLAITQAGRSFLGRLYATPPSPGPMCRTEPKRGQSPEPVPLAGSSPEPKPGDQPSRPRISTRAEELVTEIEESSTDSQDPRRFERAVRDAFAYLGFPAELLGGSGRTDVLLTARLGRSDSYKVTIDAKTTGSGRLPDQQVDWATLVEHRTDEGADHSLLVGPDPRGDRLFKRAVDYEVTVLPARGLAELCLSHARAPLGLNDYRVLFTIHGEADLTELGSRAERSERLRGLAAAICRMLAERGATVGYHRARDLWMLQPQTATKTEFQSVLDTLASPLVGAVHGDPDKGYVLATDPRVTQLRLTLLGKELAGREPG